MDDVLGYLEDLIDDLDQVPRIGFRAYRSYRPEHLVEHDARAAAACTYCHMVAEAERRFVDRAGIVAKDVRGLKVWLIRDKAVIRWKKHDEDGRTRNYPTPQALKFDRGDELPGLPPPAVRLSVGYFLNPPQTEIIRVQVAKPQGREVEWCAAIVPIGTPGSAGKRWIDVTRQRRFP
jgi:hypothetical protein